MGLKAALETESGEQVEIVYDPHNFLHRVLPSADDKASHALRYIDWYGDTVFNYLQMETFIQEWAALYTKAKTSEERNLLEQIGLMADRCQRQRLYLKFYGD